MTTLAHTDRTGADTSAPLPVFDLGIAPYRPVQSLQQRLREAVADGKIGGVLLLLEHEPVITLGTRAGPHDLRAIGGEVRWDGTIPTIPVPTIPMASPDAGRTVEIVRSERGGQATLHAPGQLVSYPIVPIPGRDLSAYVNALEEVLVLLLQGLGITAARRKGAPGLYVGVDKIASVGLRCRRWVASHGTSLNVDVDLDLFELIVSCGDPGLGQTSISVLTGRPYAMADIKATYVDAARAVFGWHLLPAQRISYERVEEALGLEVPTAGFEPATPGSGGQCSIP